MIKPQEVIKIGKVTKTHGVSGELSCTFINDIFGDEDAPYLVADIDGIFVAGDCRDKAFRQVTISTSDGTVAATEAINYLNNN